MDRLRARFGAMRSWMLSLGVAAALVAPLAMPRALAQSREDIDERCQRRIEHAEHELHEAIERHGRDSKEADHERRWHDERDWNERDHDRD